MGKTQILGIVAIVPKGDWQENTSYELLNLIRYEGASYLAIRNVPENTLPTDVNYWQLVATDGVVNFNLENGTGVGSIKSSNLNDDDRPYTEDELPVASGHEAWAFGKGCKATEKRAISWGNRNKNSGNTAVVFGQLNESTASASLTQGVNNYNGGGASVLIGQNLYNKYAAQSAEHISNDCGCGAALFGTFNYNSGTHSLTAGYGLKNTRALKTTLGLVNKPSIENFFEIGNGKSLTVDQSAKTFTYKDLTYKVNYKDNKPFSITFPADAPDAPLTLEIGNDYRVETSRGFEVCILDISGTLQVYEPYNIIEIDQLGTIIAQGGLHVKKAKSLAEMELESDGLRVQGKGQFEGNVSGQTGTFKNGLNVKKNLAEITVVDDGLNAKGWIRASNAPVNPTDVVRLQDLPAGGGKTYYKHTVRIVGVYLLDDAGEDFLVGYIDIPPFISASSSAIDSLDLLKEEFSWYPRPVATKGPYNPQGGFGVYDAQSNTLSVRTYDIDAGVWKECYGTVYYTNIEDTVTEL